jgi:hypothetical protein
VVFTHKSRKIINNMYMYKLNKTKPKIIKILYTMFIRREPRFNF